MPPAFLSGTGTQPEFGRHRKLSHRLGPPVDEQVESVATNQIRIADRAAMRLITLAFSPNEPDNHPSFVRAGLPAPITVVTYRTIQVVY